MAARTRRHLLAVLAGFGCLMCARQPSASSGAESTPDVAASWQLPRTPVIEPFPGTTGISAASCGQCHAEIYAEWKTSTHAHAWVDPQFQAELHKDPEVAWLCINCHTPMGNQQERLHTPTDQVRAPKVVDNPGFDRELQQEGITCLTCHWRADGIAAVHDDVVAPHPTVYVPELRTEDTCTSCHQAVARLEDALVCTFNTGQEWADAAPGKTCPECHMPPQRRASAPGSPERAGGRHTWPGSLIAKDTPTADERVLMEADWVPGIDLVLHAPTKAKAGERVTVSITVTNARAGHLVPTGDPERYLDVGLVALDPTGAPLSAAELRIGQKWEWWPVARRLSDNRLAPGESKVVKMMVEVPDLAGSFAVTGWVDHVRISPENAAYHDLGDYPTRRRVYTRDATIEIERATAAPSP